MLLNDHDNAPDGSDIIGYTDAARLLGVAVGTCYAWVHQGRLPHFRLSARCVRFSRRALIAFLETRAVAASTRSGDDTSVRAETPSH